MRGMCCSAYGHRNLTDLILGLLLILHSVQGGSIRCCVFANGSCKSTCEEISLVAMAMDEREYEMNLQKLNDLCHKPLMFSFWNCMNQTLEEIEKGKGWIGRPCCGIPQSEKCKMACLQAQSLLDLTHSCRKSDEIEFYSCIDTQEAGERCCRNATTSNCRDVCKKVFTSSYTSFTPTKDVRDAVHKYCSDKNSGVQQCVQAHIHVTPADHPNRNMHCCNKSPNIQCRNACKETLRTETTTQEIIDGLNRGGCGPPLPQERLWQCFLLNSAASEPGGSLVQSERVGMDSAKLQCCLRPATVNCQRLCFETFSNQWTSSWSDFERLCQDKLPESEMVRCLAEVDEPCELGCEGLSYCTNFNNRPNELFRSCDERADRAARLDVLSWEDGIIHAPIMAIPVLKVSECHSEVWKAIACVLQIKPCHHEAHVNRICKSDCIDILSKCVDRSRLSSNQNPITLCEILSAPGNDTPCISLASYLVASKHAETASEVTHPCKPNRCGPNDICMVERNCPIGQPCQPYVCVKGCRMGDMSNLIVPRNSFVRVLSNTHGYRCHMVCYCNQESLLEDCMTLPCLTTDPCFHDGKRYSHNTHFTVGCKTCFCYDGEVTCSPKECWSGLPCNCQDHYVPVCGANGKTYPSACLARCVGLTDDQFEFGACYDSDPCSPNSCHPYHRCVPKKRVCLSIRHRSCKQYDCVNMQNNCNQLPKSPVCDTDNVEHKSICWMLQRRKALAYYGKCMSHCRATGLVCGHNGETYASECAAWAERVSVDYKGACAAVGSKYGTDSHCNGIKCSPLPSEHCNKVFPPGSCCPICGAAVRLLYSQKLSDWSVEAIRDVNPVVVQTIAEKFREHVKVTECEVFAYLSLDSDIIVLVIAITDSPTRLQVEACVQEAKKLKALIQQHSPTLLTELPLSFFTAATMIDPVSDSSAQFSFNLFITILSLSISILFQKVNL